MPSAVYLDHNASTTLLPEARDAIIDALDLTGNPSSVHQSGRSLRALIEKARGEVASLIGAERGQIVFTGSATEAITQALVGGANALGIDDIVVSAGEHSAVLQAAKLASAPLNVVGLNSDGLIDLTALEKVLEEADADERRLLIAVHHVNGETGVVQPIREIEALIGPTRHLLFVDAAQACGKRSIKFAAGNIDMMAVSGHKFGGPAGVGALVMKSACDAVRLIPGGGQELGRRGGTEASALISGFGHAAAAFGHRYDADFVAGLMGELLVGINRLSSDVVVFGDENNRVENVVQFSVPNVESSVALMGLDLEGVAVSSGSACSSGKVGRSHVLDAMGVSPDLANCALRVSFGWSSTKEDVAGFLRAFEKVLDRCKKSSGRAA